MHYLEQARRDPEYFAQLITHITEDDDIATGREQLHPEWIELYEGYRQFVQRVLPQRTYRRIDEFFDTARKIDPRVGQIDIGTSTLCFLLGAGASKPEPSGIPTVKELLPDLLTRARRLDREEVTKLAEFCDETQIDNIEDLLTAAQISEFCGRSPTIMRLVEFLLFREDPADPGFRRRRRPLVDVSSVAFLQDTLQILFGLLSSRMLPAEPNQGHKAIADYLAGHANARIVTTNYDCCVDRALTAQDVPYTYCIEFANTVPTAPGNAPSIPLVKLHGSLNWFYCETCQEVHWINIEATVNDFVEDRAAYPVIGVCKTCGGQRRGLLVPPLAMKFDVAPPLNPLIDRAASAFADIDVIVVVGFSFADADLYISRMISKAMQANDKTKLLMLDPDRSVVDKVRRKFSVRIPDFDATRILSIIGDCSETLPTLLTGGFRKEEERDVEKAPTEEKSAYKRRHHLPSR
jgi:NAD-dependent SIR2 family protein deacetylase